MTPHALPPPPTKRLPIGSTARTDCPERGPLVLVLRYEGDDVTVCSRNRAIQFTTAAARLWQDAQDDMIIAKAVPMLMRKVAEDKINDGNSTV